MTSLLKNKLKLQVLYDQSKPHPMGFVQNEKKTPLQNTRDPQREAQNLVDHWHIHSEKARTICLLGLSSIHIILELLTAMRTSGSSLLILEPDPELLRAFKDANKLEELEDRFSVNVTFISNSDEDLLLKEFRHEIRQRDIFIDGLFTPPRLEKLRPELEYINKKLRVQVRLEAMDRITTISFADEWLQNCLINLPEIIQAPSINQLFGKFTQTDAVILCAGPSLSQSLKILKEKQHECLVICVGTALKPALKAGIKPHITIVVDSDPIIYKQFQGLKNPPGWFLGKYTIFPGLLQLYNDKLITFNSALTEQFSEWLKMTGFQYGTLNIGGTVALSAIDCALKLACRNIFIFGLDLAYSEDGTSHATGSIYDGHKITNGLVNVKGNRTAEVPTTKQFASYIHILNRYFKDFFSLYKGKIFNVNTAGALFQNIELIEPREFEQHHQKSLDNIQDNFKLQKQTPSPEKISQFLNDSLDELKEINTEAHTLLEEVSENKIPEGIVEFEQKIKKSKMTACFLNPALQAWCLDVSTHPEKNSHDMSVELLSQVSGAAEWVNGLLDNSLKRLIKQTQRS